MNCSKCGQDLGDMEERLAFICVMAMGDEYIYSYWFCQRCEVYSSETYHDRFSGEDSIHTSRPIPKEDGDKLVALIKKCPDPTDKRCNCDTHRYFL